MSYAAKCGKASIGIVVQCIGKPMLSYVTPRQSMAARCSVAALDSNAKALCGLAEYSNGIVWPHDVLVS